MPADGQMLITLFSNVHRYQICVNKRYAKYPWEIYHSAFFGGNVFIKCVVNDAGVINFV